MMALACIAMPALVGAQRPTPWSGIRGVVVDTAGQPLEGAEVGDALGARTLTDAAGRFAFPPRAYAYPFALTVRRLGYAAQSVTVTATVVDTALRIVLRASGQVLDPVVVVDTRPPELIANGFYDRQRKYTGRWLDSMALRQYSSTGLVGVLRETNRVSIRRMREGDYAYTSTAGRQCRMNVYIDGRFERAALPGPAGDPGLPLRELIAFDAILAIEIYPTLNSVPVRFQRAGLAAGPAGNGSLGQIPSPGAAPRGGPPPPNESGDAACGAIVIWTKRAEGKEPQ